jgi:trehalose utilization protein
MIKVHVWSENKPLKEHEEKMHEIYPKGVHGAIADFLVEEPDFSVTTGVMADPDQGLSEDRLTDTDVLVFWSHKFWRELQDSTA